MPVMEPSMTTKSLSALYAFKYLIFSAFCELCVSAVITLFFGCGCAALGFSWRVLYRLVSRTAPIKQPYRISGTEVIKIIANTISPVPAMMRAAISGATTPAK